MQINLTGFLNGRNARIFMSELWDLLLSAQDSATGIPEVFMAQKKEEIRKRQVKCPCHFYCTCCMLSFQLAEQLVTV